MLHSAPGAPARCAVRTVKFEGCQAIVQCAEQKGEGRGGKGAVYRMLSTTLYVVLGSLFSTLF